VFLVGCVTTPTRGAYGQTSVIDQIRELMKMCNYSPNTIQPFLNWIRLFILFHGSLLILTKTIQVLLRNTFPLFSTKTIRSFLVQSRTRIITAPNGVFGL